MPPRGDDDFNDCTRVRICQSQAAAQLGDALSHTSNANPNAVRAKLDNVVPNSLAIVAHDHDDLSLGLFQTDSTVMRSGMPEHVGQGFLNHSKNGSFQIGLETTKIGRFDLELNINSTSLRQSLQKPAESGHQANLIEKWGM